MRFIYWRLLVVSVIMLDNRKRNILGRLIALCWCTHFKCKHWLIQRFWQLTAVNLNRGILLSILLTHRGEIAFFFFNKKIRKKKKEKKVQLSFGITVVIEPSCHGMGFDNRIYRNRHSRKRSGTTALAVWRDVKATWYGREC